MHLTPARDGQFTLAKGGQGHGLVQCTIKRSQIISNSFNMKTQYCIIIMIGLYKGKSRQSQ